MECGQCFSQREKHFFSYRHERKYSGVEGIRWLRSPPTLNQGDSLLRPEWHSVAVHGCELDRQPVSWCKGPGEGANLRDLRPEMDSRPRTVVCKCQHGLEESHADLVGAQTAVLPPQDFRTSRSRTGMQVYISNNFSDIIPELLVPGPHLENQGYWNSVNWGQNHRRGDRGRTCKVC